MIAWKLTRNQPDAEELVQAAICRCLAAWEGFSRNRGNFVSWVARVMKNKFLDGRRRSDFWHFRIDAENDDGLSIAETIGEMDADPVDQTARVECIKTVGDAVASLDDEDREIIRLREFDMLDYETIAVITRLPIGTVRSRLYRARNRLRDILAAYFELKTGGSNA